MSARERERIAQRKANLIARSEFERVRMSLLVHQLREQLAPPRLGGPKGGRASMIAAAVVGIGLPLLGRGRLSRLLRAGSAAMTMWRIARGWRTGRDR